MIFKAKRISDKEWEIGYYVKMNGKHYIVPLYASAWYGIEIDPETLLSYTGAEVNGRMVFDGDIFEKEGVETTITVKYRKVCDDKEKINSFKKELDGYYFIGNIYDKENEK